MEQTLVSHPYPKTEIAKVRGTVELWLLGQVPRVPGVTDRVEGLSRTLAKGVQPSMVARSAVEAVARAAKPVCGPVDPGWYTAHEIACGLSVDRAIAPAEMAARIIFNRRPNKWDEIYRLIIKVCDGLHISLRCSDFAGAALGVLKRWDTETGNYHHRRGGYTDSLVWAGADAVDHHCGLTYAIGPGLVFGAAALQNWGHVPDTWGVYGEEAFAVLDSLQTAR